jgi:D-glycero-D-manno-heptose 1,7-bisphosphate phosphatase
VQQPIIYKYSDIKSFNTLYLDRDGVLNRAVIRQGEISSPRDIIELNVSPDISALAKNPLIKDWNLVLVTNQPDLSRNLIDLDLIESINEKILSFLPINMAYICPHMAKHKCRCRKPNTGMIDEFRFSYPKALRKELFIGDRSTDLECARSLEIPFLLRQRHYNEHLLDLSDRVIENLGTPDILD